MLPALLGLSRCPRHTLRALCNLPNLPCACCTAPCAAPALQRVDRFDSDIANIITNSAKRSGLTFAPEAGTQVGHVGRCCCVI